MPTQSVQTWRPRIPMKRWGWDSIGTKRSGDPQLFALGKGKHTLTISAGEGQRIDKIVVSNDPTWEQNGFRTLRKSKI